MKKVSHFWKSLGFIRSKRSTGWILERIGKGSWIHSCVNEIERRFRRSYWTRILLVFIHFLINVLLTLGSCNVMHLLARIGDFLRSKDPVEDVIKDPSDLASSELLQLFDWSDKILIMKSYWDTISLFY